MKIRFKRLTATAVAPTRAHESDCGFDLTATSVKKDEYGNYVYGTGIAVEIPEDYGGFCFQRSSVCKKTIILTNCVGVIDSGYRGEILFKFKPLTSNFEVYKVGERIGQLVILELPKIEFEESEELSESERGAGGYGSSGK